MRVIEKSITDKDSREVGGPRAVVVVLALLIGLLTGFGLGRVETTRPPVEAPNPAVFSDPGIQGPGHVPRHLMVPLTGSVR